MSAVVAQSRSRKGPTILYAIAAVVVAAAILAVVMGAQRPIPIKVDGKTLEVSRKTTVAELAGAKSFTAKHGDLMSVQGKVLKKGGGAAPVYYRNGAQVPGTQLVYADDVLTSQRGRDVTEKVVTKTRTIPPDTITQGNGPIGETVREGKPGVQELKVGEISNARVSAHWVSRPVAEIVKFRRMTGKDKVVALTFDDGPWPRSTAAILDILKKNNVKATFFMLGNRAQAMPDTARRVVAEGHTIGEHSWSHVYMRKGVSASVIKRQVEGGKSAVSKATGVDVRWYRPPGGIIDGRQYAVVKADGMTVVQWDIDSNDWRRPGRMKIVSTVVHQAKPGRIILMHDGGGDRSQTVAALDQVIKTLRSQGYSFVTLDQLKGRK